MVCGLFKGAQYNSEAGAKCADYSRARTKQGRGVIEEIRFSKFSFLPLSFFFFLVLCRLNALSSLGEEFYCSEYFAYNLHVRNYDNLHMCKIRNAIAF